MARFNHRQGPGYGLKLADVPALVAHIASLPLTEDGLEASRLLIAGIDNAFDVPTEPSEEPYESGALSCAIGTVNGILDEKFRAWFSSQSLPPRQWHEGT